VADLPLAEEDTLTVDASITTSTGSKVFVSLSETVSHMMKDAPTCPSCGHLAVRNGACFKCINCGESLGCS
jgi:ribonucleoside-diphosphate reductase alpha chain